MNPPSAILAKETHPDKVFRLHKTTIELRSLPELAEALEIMSDESFCHHVTEKHNDFAVWVGETMDDKELSNKLSGISDRKSAFRIVKDHIKQLSGSHVKSLPIQFTRGLFVGLVFGILLTLLALRILTWLM